jgi:HK97 family phage portal protein
VKIIDYFKNIGSALAGRPNAAIPSTLERLILDIYGGGTTASGVSVTSDTAMRLITVQNCVRMRAATLQRIPCHIMERNNGRIAKAENFYLYEKLLHQPNSWMSAPDFWGMAEAYISLRGNFVCYKVMVRDQIRELLPITSEMLHSITQNPDYSLDYEIRFPDGSIRHLNGSQVLHLRGLTLNGYSGVNPIEYARETIGLRQASRQFLAQYFGKGMRPGVIFEHPLTLSAAAYANRKAALSEKYQGLGKHWEMMLIDEGMKATFPEIKLVDAQFIEQMKLTDAQICGLYRVPLMLINAGDKEPTYASAEQFMLFYQMFSIDNVNYESALRRDILTEEERQRYYFKFNVNALMRGSMKDRAEFYRNMINSEVLSPNECRELEDMNPYDGGNEYRTRTSTVRQTGSAEQGGQEE